MRAEIVSVGTELLLGTITDTNASYLAQRLAALGIDCYYISQVGDNLGRIVETLGRGVQRSDLVITTGGLGPTQDDLTREAISSLLGEEMVVSPELEAELRARFAQRGYSMPERNLKQASLTSSARALPNPVGTAPGWWVSLPGGGERAIISMPGVPYEMHRMWENEVEPRLRQGQRSTLVSRTLKVLGLGESAVEEAVADLMSGANPTLAPYAKQDGVHLRISAKGANRTEAEHLVASLESQVRERLGDAIYGIDEETPQGVVRGMLHEWGYRLAGLEIGRLAAGSFAGFARDEGSGRALHHILTVPGLQALSQAVPVQGNLSDCGDLECAAREYGAITGSDVVLAVSADDAESGGGSSRGVVVARCEIVALTPSQGSEPHLTRVRQTWRTEGGEVARMLGLAAYNLLRLRLLKVKRQGS
jgi:competence/damage-inducible protein CinA-like protein